MERILWAVSPAALLVTSASLCAEASSEAIIRVGATALLPGLLLDGALRGNTNAGGVSGLLGSIIVTIGSLLFWSFVGYFVVVMTSTISYALGRHKNDRTA